MPVCNYKPFLRPKKALRATLLRDYRDGEPQPLRRTPSIVQIAVTPAADGGFVVEAAGTSPFILTASQLRCWPVVQRHLEDAIAFPVQRISRRAWAWDLAKRGLAPWTAEARQYDEANDKGFDDAFERHCEWMDAVGRDMARRRAETRRA